MKSEARPRDERRGLNYGQEMLEESVCLVILGARAGAGEA